MKRKDFIDVIVAKKEEIAKNIIKILLKPTRGVLPNYDAGAHIDVHFNDYIRQYSLVGNPTCSKHLFYEIAVLKESDSRGGSKYLHEKLSIGERLKISNPKNNFPLKLISDEEQYLLIAGGIGITPIISMAYELGRLNKKFTLHYYTRSKEATAYEQFLSSSFFSDLVYFHRDNISTERLDIEDLLKETNLTSHIYVCGPSGLIEKTMELSSSFGFNKEQVHYELFEADATALQLDGSSFIVQIASSGQAITVGQNETIIQALEKEGIFIPTSCAQGVCGTCLTAVLEGELDHRDQYLTNEEKALNNQMTPCCSRAFSKKITLGI